jgi:hypothetical protein
MNGWQRLFGPTDKGKVIFIGGRAPSHWRRELARCISRLGTLRRACAWVETEARSQPKLCDGPLLGACLTTLTGYEVADSGSLEPGTPRPQRPGSAKPEPLRKHDWDWSGLGKVTEKQTSPLKPEAPQPQRSGLSQLKPRLAPMPLQLSAKAGRTLLSKLTGQKMTAEGPGWSQQRPPGAASAVRTRVPPPAVLERADQQDWLHDLARRAERALRRKELERGPKFPSGSPDQPRPDRAPALAEQWAIPLQGESAPADLLVRLVSPSRSDGDHAGGEAQAEGTPRQPSGARTENRHFRLQDETVPPHITENRPLAESLASTGGEAPDGVSSGQPVRTDSSDQGHLLSPQTVSSRPAGVWAGSPSLATDSTGNPDGQREAPVRIAPPREAPVLPSLRPPRRVNEPISPLAAAIIKQEARQVEEATDEEDLTALSTKIKRILDEEARRHGIDV